MHEMSLLHSGVYTCINSYSCVCVRVRVSVYACAYGHMFVYVCVCVCACFTTYLYVQKSVHGCVCSTVEMYLVETNGYGESICTKLRLLLQFRQVEGPDVQRFELGRWQFKTKTTLHISSLPQKNVNNHRHGRPDIEKYFIFPSPALSKKSMFCPT